MKQLTFVDVEWSTGRTLDSSARGPGFNPTPKPKTAFIMFCKEYKVVLQQTILTMGEKGVFDAKLIEDKIKKTYKNRYFMLTNK